LGAPQRSGVEDNQNGENNGPEKQEGGEYVESPKRGPEYCQKHSEQDNANNHQDERPARISRPSAGGFSTEWVNMSHCIFGGSAFASTARCGSAMRHALAPKPSENASVWADTTRPYPMGQEGGLAIVGQSLSSRLNTPERRRFGSLDLIFSPALTSSCARQTSAYWLSSSSTNQMRSLGNSPVF
jgi:hypothetical protein